MAITPLPPAPSRASPADFSTKADALLGALDTFVTEANAQAAALTLNSVTSFATTSLTIGTGSKTITVSTGLSYQKSMTIKVAYVTNPTIWMHGIVISYNSGTGALVFESERVAGSGTYATWIVTFSAPIDDANGFASGTKLVFLQAAAPTYWTLDATHNDKALRVVSSSGGGSGGTHDLSAPPSLAHVHTGPSHTHTGPSHTHTTAGHALTEAENGAHTHTISEATGGAYTVNAPAVGNNGGTTGSLTTSSSGSGTAHGHGDTGAAGTGATGASGTANTGSTTPTAFAPKYVDVIICTRD